MKKKTCVLGMAVLLAALMALTGVAQSAMWVGGQIGGNYCTSTSMAISAPGFRGGGTGSNDYLSVIGGAALGYDFINAGFGAYDWPDWMKYFSVFTDFTYNRRDGRAQGRHSIPAAYWPYLRPQNARIEGYDACWSFMLMAHYPFLPDSEVPTGRLNPYVAVGPGILFSAIDIGKGWGGGSSVNIALVVEGGIRFMCLKNVSLDAACRYRYATPNYDLDSVNGTADDDSLNMISFLFRANYHF